MNNEELMVQGRFLVAGDQANEAEKKFAATLGKTLDVLARLDVPEGMQFNVCLGPQVIETELATLSQAYREYFGAVNAFVSAAKAANRPVRVVSSV